MVASTRLSTAWVAVMGSGYLRPACPAPRVFLGRIGVPP
jgi:hypothetical protein